MGKKEPPKETTTDWMEDNQNRRPWGGVLRTVLELYTLTLSVGGRAGRGCFLVMVAG